MLYLSAPANYILELTTRCNNRCVGCGDVYLHCAPAPLSSSAWMTIIDGIAKQAVQITLSGGEPTQHPEFLDILARATSFGVQVNIFTNGRWAEPQDFVEQLQGIPNLGGLLVSLHGAAAETS